MLRFPRPNPWILGALTTAVVGLAWCTAPLAARAQQAPAAPVIEDAADAALPDGLLPADAGGRALTPDEIKPLLRAHPELTAQLLPAMLAPTPDAPAEWACLGCHESQVAAKPWIASLHKHAGATCRNCHPEAAVVPHPDVVSKVRCGDCHDGTDAIEAGAQTSAHGPHGPGAANGCAGCHDPHTMAQAADAGQMAQAGCLACHDRDEGLADKHGAFLCSPELHLAKVGCQYCHLSGTDATAVHNVKYGEAARIACEDCHGKDSMLALAGEIDPELEDDPGLLRTQNRRLIRETGYLIGANRIVGLDWAIVLLVIGACCFPVVHGGLRALFRRSR